MSTQKPFFKKILVIDDSETDRYIAKRMFEKYHFAEELVLKESAMKALEYLKSLEETPEELPKYIFLDIRMPEVDGFGFLEEYSKLPDCVKSNCVIMMLSTSLDPNDHEKANTNPYVFQFMNKPLDKHKMDQLEGQFKHTN
ncbi:MAG TPA: response regulator [Bacteroidia bacterium]|nr:response regulator [Bacteroidia bacterium]HNT79809.1 response regulator [Bacteroidia bacterium]